MESNIIKFLWVKAYERKPMNRLISSLIQKRIIEFKTFQTKAIFWKEKLWHLTAVEAVPNTVVLL